MALAEVARADASRARARLGGEVSPPGVQVPVPQAPLSVSLVCVGGEGPLTLGLAPVRGARPTTQQGVRASARRPRPGTQVGGPRMPGRGLTTAAGGRRGAGGTAALGGGTWGDGGAGSGIVVAAGVGASLGPGSGWADGWVRSVVVGGLGGEVWPGLALPGAGQGPEAGGGAVVPGSPSTRVPPQEHEREHGQGQERGHGHGEVLQEEEQEGEVQENEQQHQQQQHGQEAHVVDQRGGDGGAGPPLPLTTPQAAQPLRCGVGRAGDPSTTAPGGIHGGGFPHLHPTDHSVDDGLGGVTVGLVAPPGPAVAPEAPHALSTGSTPLCAGQPCLDPWSSLTVVTGALEPAPGTASPGVVEPSGHEGAATPQHSPPLPLLAASPSRPEVLTHHPGPDRAHLPRLASLASPVGGRGAPGAAALAPSHSPSPARLQGAVDPIPAHRGGPSWPNSAAPSPMSSTNEGGWSPAAGGGGGGGGGARPKAGGGQASPSLPALGRLGGAPRGVGGSGLREAAGVPSAAPRPPPGRALPPVSPIAVGSPHRGV
jgi:hypothetical protein